MPYVRGFLRVMRRDRWGRPVDPDYGIDVGEEGGEGGSPDHGFHPDYPWQGGPGGGYPGRPGQGLPRPPWGGERPGQGLPPSYPGRPVDPGYGVEGAGSGQLPVFPLEPPGAGGAPDQGLPQEPGTIWPPLPDGGIGFHGKAVLGCYAYYGGAMHHHFVVVTIPDVPPERPGLTPPAGGIGGTPPPRPGSPIDPARR
jgi:hypothetical protein